MLFMNGMWLVVERNSVSVFIVPYWAGTLKCGRMSAAFSLRNEVVCHWIRIFTNLIASKFPSLACNRRGYPFSHVTTPVFKS